MLDRLENETTETRTRRERIRPREGVIRRSQQSRPWCPSDWERHHIVWGHTECIVLRHIIRLHFDLEWYTCRESKPNSLKPHVSVRFKIFDSSVA